MPMERLTDFVQHRAEPGDLAVSLPDHIGRRYFYLCTDDSIGTNIKNPAWYMINEEILKKYEKETQQYDFQVGDQVITSLGEVGTIANICKCEQCRERGFYEPVVDIPGKDAMFITNADKMSGFKNYYRIGKYKFGNTDRETLRSQIISSTKTCEEMSSNIVRYTEQLRILDQLEDEEK